MGNWCKTSHIFQVIKKKAVQIELRSDPEPLECVIIICGDQMYSFTVTMIGELDPDARRWSTQENDPVNVSDVWGDT